MMDRIAEIAEVMLIAAGALAACVFVLGLVWFVVTRGV